MAIYIGNLPASLKRKAAQLSDTFSKEIFKGIWNKEIKGVLITAKSISLAVMTALLAIVSVWAYMSFFSPAPQKKKFFQADGKAPAAGTINNKLQVSSEDRYLLARVIEGEASGEPMEGKIAVGAVIVNRTENGDFPGEISGVVYQPLAFEAVSNGIYSQPASGESMRAADLAINGQDPTGGALYYWNPSTASSKWVWQRPIVKSIGRHVFAK